MSGILGAGPCFKGLHQHARGVKSALVELLLLIQLELII